MFDIYGEQLEEEVQEEVEKKVQEEVEKGKRSAEKNVEKRFNSLLIKLMELGRTDDLIQGAKNPEYQKKLFEEFGL